MRQNIPIELESSAEILAKITLLACIHEEKCV
jgi:hypothetical protein